MKIPNFPHEILVELTNEPYFIGRITINKLASNFSAEIDIINKETRKIFKHVDILYNIPDCEEAIEMGVQRLAKFLNPRF